MQSQSGLVAPQFALIGVAGFVAPRHLNAIREIGGILRAAVDPNDSVGIMDSYFPDVRFFTEFERFDRYIDRIKREGQGVHYISICSPNYLHDAHTRFALRSDADAICEKPLVLNPKNIDGLEAMERETGRKVCTILQLRLHPTIVALRNMVTSGPSSKVYNVDLTYITSRGRWYYVSWKGDSSKSGGVATNIGVHFFDMLSFIFGAVKENIIHHRAMDCAAGHLVYERARVRWFLSINRHDLPNAVSSNQSTYRCITVDRKELEFSGGFTDLHTASYMQIVGGKGFTLADVRPSIETVADIRSAPIQPNKGDQHPLLKTVFEEENRYLNGWPI